jgi:hypothetical protein
LADRVFPRTLELPEKLRLQLAQFLLDKKTGNIVLNVKEGQILGFKVEELFSIK